jgi:hypothetical protein
MQPSAVMAVILNLSSPVMDCEKSLLVLTLTRSLIRAHWYEAKPGEATLVMFVPKQTAVSAPAESAGTKGFDMTMVSRFIVPQPLVTAIQ